MNGYTLVVAIIICLVTACIMPTIGHRMTELDKQADARVEQLKDMGRM